MWSTETGGVWGAAEAEAEAKAAAMAEMASDEWHASGLRGQ